MTGFSLGPRQLAALLLAVALAAPVAASAQQPGDAADGAAAAEAGAAADAGAGLPGDEAMAAARGGDGRGPVTNLPLPRYVSLKGSEGNARRGPSLSHRIDWVFRHAGMPLRVTAEYGHWRRVEDAEGAGGWVHYSLLSGVRTAIILQDMTELRARPDENASVTARAELGAIVKLGACTAGWCQITGGGASGWVLQSQIWGVDPGEERE